ncbi:MAG: hypothetical protein Fur0024_4620 [Patescibacteria group bacterium]
MFEEKKENENFDVKYTPVQQIFYHQIEDPTPKKKTFLEFLIHTVKSFLFFVKDFTIKNFGWIVVIMMFTSIVPKGEESLRIDGYSKQDLKFDFKTSEAKNSKSEIAIININSGIDTYSSDSYIGIDEIKNLMLDANKNEKVKAIVLLMNSPGGSVIGSKNLYDFVKNFDKTKKPVYTYIQNIGASGAYMTALGTRKIYADPNSMVGSVGVIMEIANFSKFLDKVGVDLITIKSGEYKDAGYYGRELNEKDLAYFQEMIDEAFIDFKSLVKEKREGKIINWDDVFSGKVYSGVQGKKVGIIDEVGSLEDLLNEIFNVQNLKKEETRVFMYSKKTGFLYSLLNLNSQSFKIFGIELANYKASKKTDNFNQASLKYEWKV